MSRPGTLAFERSFPPSVESVREARRFACESARSLGSTGAIDRVELVVGELAVNAVLHGRTEYTVTVTAPAAGTVRIEMCDGNAELPRRKAVTGDDVLMHGRGLALIDGAADRWGVVSRDDGKCIWAEVEE